MAVSVLAAAVMSLVVTAGTASAAFSGVVAWGHNSSAQLGTGSDAGPESCSNNEPCAKVPVAVSGLSGVKSLAAGAYHGLAVLNDGTVESWGDSSLGQFSKSPIPVGGISTATEVAAGPGFSLALLEDGTVMAWGDNYAGQLGDGTTTERSTPVPVSGLSEAVAIAAGQDFSLALLEDGTVMAWGDNYAGQLGDGTTINSDTPVPVSGLSEVVAIAAGPAHSLALLKDGTVKAWGSNVAGQLGIGTNTGPEICNVKSFLKGACSKTPIAVSGISDAVSVAAGGEQGSEGRSFAVLEDGTVLGWGENWGGRLGIGSSTGPETCEHNSSPEFPCSTVPAAVIGLTEVKSVVVGWAHNLALLESGVVMSWGFNQFGQLGDGTTTGTESPVAVDGLSGATVIAAGREAHTSYASGSFSTLPTVTTVEPNYGPIGGGTSVKLVGADLSGTTAVKFGSADAESFTVDSPTEIHAVAPPGTGVVNVRVTTSAGTSPIDEGNVFNYSPVVTKVEPNDGPLAGGTMVKIVGGNFTGATEVTFSSYFDSANAESFTVNSDTEIHAVSPEGYGVVDVTVTGPGGTSTKTWDDQFGYGPIIDRIEPGYGPGVGGTEITITGFALTEVEAVRFGSVAAASFTENPDGTVSAVSPAFAGGWATVPVTVTTPNGESTTCKCSSLLPDNYFYYAPTVTSIDPNEGSSAGGDQVTIHGTGFYGLNWGSEIPYVESVNFGSSKLTCGATEIPWESCSPAEFEVKSETEIVATVPPGSGTVDVTVTTHAGTSPVSPADQYSYEPTGPPPVPLTIDYPGSGSGQVNCEVNGGPTVDEPCASSYPEGTELELFAAADPGSVFEGFENATGSATGCEAEGSPCGPFTLEAASELDALFVRETRELEIEEEGPGTVEVLCKEDASFEPCADPLSELPYGTEVKVTAKPDTGAKIEEFAGTGSASGCEAAGSPCTFALTEDSEVSALFALETFALTIETSGEGAVEAECEESPASFEPCADPLGELPYGTEVKLTAEEEIGWEFSAWSGECDTTTGHECELEIDADKSVEATFVLEGQKTLTIVTSGGTGAGSVNCEVNGGERTDEPCHPAYSEGTELKLIPAPAEHSAFAGYNTPTGSISCTGLASCEFTINLNSSVNAPFNLEPPSEFALTVSLAGSGSGTVTSSPAGINCGIDCSDAYAAGAEVTLTATPASGSTFSGWSGACTGTGSCIVTMSATRSVTATFEKEATPPPGPGTAVVASTAKVKGGKALLKLTCKGEGACKGTLKLTAKVKVGKKTMNKVIGKASFSIAKGKKKTIEVKLSGPAKKKVLKAKVTGSGVRSRTVTLKP